MRALCFKIDTGSIWLYPLKISSAYFEPLPLNVGRLTLERFRFLADLDRDLRPDFLPLGSSLKVSFLSFFLPFEVDLRESLRPDILFDLDLDLERLLPRDKRPFEMEELRETGVLIFSRVPLLLRSG